MTEPDPSERASALDWAVARGRAAELVAELQRRAQRRRRRRGTLAGLAALLVTTAVWWDGPEQGRPAPASRPALVLEPARHTLPDGSQVELRDGAQFAVEFTPEARRLTLVRGEGHFTVRKDPARPFIVSAGGVAVRAIGTAFSVQMDEQDVAVLVTAGRVAVERPEPILTARPAAPARPLAVLDAGTRAVIGRLPGDPPPVLPPLQITHLSASEISERLQWRAPRLEFSATRLGEALILFNRHSPYRLALGEPQLAEVRVSGIVRADNVDALLQLLQANYGVTARPGEAGELILDRRR